MEFLNDSTSVFSHCVCACFFLVFVFEGDFIRARPSDVTVVFAVFLLEPTHVPPVLLLVHSWACCQQANR